MTTSVPAFRRWRMFSTPSVRSNGHLLSTADLRFETP